MEEVEEAVLDEQEVEDDVEQEVVVQWGEWSVEVTD